MNNLNLVMTFKNEGGKNSTLTVKNVKADLSKETIQAAMEAILENNVFVTPLGDLKTIISAELVEKTVTDMLKEAE